MIHRRRWPRNLADHPWIGVLLLSVGFTAWYGFDAGLDINWDLLNYHYWAVFALFEGRVFFDIAPAQVQTWLNPLIYIPAYLAIEYLSPAGATLFLSAIAGLNGVFLYFLGRTLVAGQPSYQSWLVVFLMIVIGLTGPIFLSQVGTSFADPICSLLILGGIALLFVRQRNSLLFSGLALGAAVGFKLTTAPFAIALFVALLVTWRYWGLTPRRVTAFIAGGMVGALITGGYWALSLYLETGNPVFPFYNSVFQSPLYGLENFADKRFRPESFLSALGYPVQLLLGQHPTAEFPFRDPRFFLINALLAIYIVQRAMGRHHRSEADGERSAIVRFYLTFFVLSYALWLYLWGIQRYATTLELMSGLMMFLLIDQVVAKQDKKVVTFLLLTLLTLAMTTPANWGRLEFTDSHFVHQGHDQGSAEPNRLYLILGPSDPLAFRLPAMASQSRFVRLSGNHGTQHNDAPLGEWIASVIQQHSGPMRTLSVGSPQGSDQDIVASYGLGLQVPWDCETFQAKPLADLWSCKLVRNSH